MSTKTMMALFMNILGLLFSAAMSLSDQNTLPLTSFTIGENVTYDCIDIYKQPSLDHPSLKNHTIQMKSSNSIRQLKSQIENNKTYKSKINCPDGTVPIMRNSKEFMTNAQTFADKFVHPLSVDSPGTHVAGIKAVNGPFHGVESLFDVFNLNVGKDQASYSQIYVGSGSKNQVNYISSGFMINPSYFGDGRVWHYGFWKGKDGKGCYNTACNGFVQVSKVVPIVEPIDLSPGKPNALHSSIHQDKNTGNWWLTQVNPHGPNEDVGYWPKELFNLFGNGANMAGVGGVVQASRNGPSPPMGNGQFPSDDIKKSTVFANIEVFDFNYNKRQMNLFRIETLVDSPKCYGLRIGKEKFLRRSSYGFHINYGGPGGNSCGV
ncbi:unnamed protein product [Cochlearia groenlandica]